MIDLAINDNGDIMFSKDQNKNKKELRLNFIISESNSLRLNFFINNISNKRKLNNKLKLEIDVYKPEFNKNSEIISEEEELEQAIKLRISTVYSSVRGNENMGSKIEKYKHNYIEEKDLMTILAREIRAAISDILPNCEIKISKHKTYYREFYNALKITVIDKGKYFYYYL